MEEKNIIIGDHVCTTSQQMTIRVALNSFKLELNTEGLGEDEIGKVITEGYIKNINDLFKIM